MALGAITSVSEKGAKTLEPRFKAHVQFAGDGSYPTGGSTGFAALIASALDKEGVDIISVSRVGLCGGFTPIYDSANDALLVTRTAGINAADEEVPNTTNLSGVTFDLLVEYR